jgi:phosphoribosylaminoimidazolecarboxamide formyltransferase/IMP cyclohydrolase
MQKNKPKCNLDFFVTNSIIIEGELQMRALISVSDKTGILEFAKALCDRDIEIISTGGTAITLADNGIKVTNISEITGFPECLDGRVKTLHPAVHGGILAMRSKKDHMDQLRELHIKPIDLVVINLYPFKKTILRSDTQLEEAIENIDIGGPTMLRSAAKNHKDVTVVCDPEDYTRVMEELNDSGKVSYYTKYRLALKVFEHTAAYDAMIADYLRKEISAELPDNLTLTFEKVQDLRYGENAHQKAAYYKEIKPGKGDLVNALQIHGKELSFNNINDTNGALETLKEFSEPAVVAVKHATPCGVGVGYDIYDAYLKAYKADPISIYGGILAMNREIDEHTANEIKEVFIEVILAPGYSPEALEILKAKKNIRLLLLPGISEQAEAGTKDFKKVSGGLLIQDKDQGIYVEEDLKIVTSRIPTEREMLDMAFAMKVVKHIKSNGIVIAREGRTLGVGPGQVNRIWAVENAIRQATDETRGAVLASDAFFPFDDCVAAAAQAGISAIIQPGGSVNDEASINKANELGIAMVFTGMRHFKH